MMPFSEMGDKRKIEHLKMLLDSALNAIDWYRDEHPEDASQVDDEFRDECMKVLNDDT